MKIGMSSMIDETSVKLYIVPSIITFCAALILAFILLMMINAAMMRVPTRNVIQPQKTLVTKPIEGQDNSEQKYSSIADRNLFRSKLQIELPKPKTDKEIEEEKFINILQTLSLKGVWIGDEKMDHFVFLDKGTEKGVWIHRKGEQIEGGLTVTEINPNSVLITKGELAAILTLFTKGFERTSIKKINKTQATKLQK